MSELLSPEKLQELVEEQGKKIEVLSKKIEEQGDLIDQQNKVIGNAKAATKIDTVEKKLPAVPKEPIKIGDKEYQWMVASFQLPGHANKYSAEEAGTDSKILGAILKIEGQRILKELV